jgi:hypothetical protein
MEDHTVVPVSGLTGHVGWGIGPELPRLQEMAALQTKLCHSK